MISIFGITIVLYFINIFSGSRNNLYTAIVSFLLAVFYLGKTHAQNTHITAEACPRACVQGYAIYRRQGLCSISNDAVGLSGYLLLSVLNSWLQLILTK